MKFTSMEMQDHGRSGVGHSIQKECYGDKEVPGVGYSSGLDKLCGHGCHGC